MFDFIKADAGRYFAIDGWEQGGTLGKIFVLFFSYGFHATIVYRFGRAVFVFKKNLLTVPFYYLLNVLYLLLSRLVGKMYGIQIDRNAEIGKGFYIGHFGGVKVGRCRIGSTCNIHQLTQIGNGCVLGSHVWVGAHAVIADGITLEDCSTVTVAARVGANVSSRSLVAGNPARTIKINFDNSGMLGVTAIENNNP